MAFEHSHGSVQEAFIRVVDYSVSMWYIHAFVITNTCFQDAFDLNYI